MNTDLALRYFNEAETTLDRWIGIAQLNMQQIMAPLQGTGLYSVEVCADALKRHASEPALDADAIGSLLEKVHELQREVGGPTTLTAPPRIGPRDDRAGDE